MLCSPFYGFKNKVQKQTHLFLQEFSQIYGNVSISFSGPFYPSMMVHINPKFWGNMNHPVGM